jgi:protocatechuate 3,4-dioxygenase beta subunit
MHRPSLPFLAPAAGIACAAILLLLAACPRAGASPETPVVGLPCEDCEVPLIGMPADPPGVARLAPDGELGERLRLAGRVVDAQGRPRAGVIVYANHTSQEGVYPDADTSTDPGARRHGRLRGWAATDADGQYAFLTVRPGSYPGTTMPQHVHLYVIEPGCALYYIDDVMFTDDPHLTPALARREQGRGGAGIVAPTRGADGWQARRDIVLGRNIPGYPGCGT